MSSDDPFASCTNAEPSRCKAKPPVQTRVSNQGQKKRGGLYHVLVEWLKGQRENQGSTTRPKALSDLESFLESRNDLARARNRLFMEHFEELRRVQIKAESALERLRANPITLRAMAEMGENPTNKRIILDEVERRRTDPYSADSDECNAALRDFEALLSTCCLQSYKALELSLLAPLPELGRPAALQKNLWIFFRILCECKELSVFYADGNVDKTLHSKVVGMVEEIMKFFASAKEKLDALYHNLEQPLEIDLMPFFPKKSENDTY